MILSEEMREFEPISINALSSYDETIQETFKLYNSALSYIKNNSEDIAIICLKKALAINDGFIEAHNLIALLYIYTKEYKKALQSIEKVLSIDSDNKKAAHYLDFIKAEDSELLKPTAYAEYKSNDSKKNHNNKIDGISADEYSGLGTTTRKNVTDNDYRKNVKEVKRKNKNKQKIKIYAYSCLLVAVLLIVFAFIGANMKGDKVTKKDNVVKKNKTAVTVKNKKSENKAKKKKDTKPKNVENKKNEDKDSEVTDDTSVTDNASKNDDKKTEIDNKDKNDNTVVNDNNKDNGNATNDGIKPAQNNPNNFNTGSTLYKSGKFKEALPYLLAYEQSGSKDVRRKLALFYIGSAYYQINNKDKVSEYYDKLHSEYPGSDAEGWLKWRVDKTK